MWLRSSVRSSCATIPSSLAPSFPMGVSLSRGKRTVRTTPRPREKMPPNLIIWMAFPRRTTRRNRPHHPEGADRKRSPQSNTAPRRNTRAKPMARGRASPRTSLRTTAKPSSLSFARTKTSLGKCWQGWGWSGRLSCGTCADCGPTSTRSHSCGPCGCRRKTISPRSTESYPWSTCASIVWSTSSTPGCKIFTSISSIGIR